MPWYRRFKLFDNCGVEVVTDQLIRPSFCLRAGIRHDSDSPLIPDAIAACGEIRPIVQLGRCSFLVPFRHTE
jgi:hypothetical protein